MEAVSVVLPSGREFLLPAEGAANSNMSFEDVAFHLEFREIVDVLKEIGEMLHDALRTIKPRRASVELDIGVDGRTGKITAFFVDAGAHGSLRLRLEWGGGDEE